MIQNMPFRIDGERLRFRGLSFGYGDSDPWLLAKGSRFLVMRKPGTSEWSQIGSSRYHPARITLIEFKPDGDEFRVVRVVQEEEPGRFWRRERASFIEMMEWKERGFAAIEKAEGKKA